MRNISTYKSGRINHSHHNKKRIVLSLYIFFVFSISGIAQISIRDLSKDNTKKQTSVPSSQFESFDSFQTKQSNKKIKKNKNRSVQNEKDGDITLLADIFGGYSNFRCEGISPKSNFGFGADIGLRFDYSRLFGKMPTGLFGELAIGYSLRGSGACHINYIGARVLPLGYRYSINSDISILGKAGMYFAYPLSRFKTRYNSYDTNFDYGISIGLGIEWKKFGFMATYEHGFPDVKDGGGVDLHNQCFFITISYKILTF